MRWPAAGVKCRPRMSNSWRAADDPHARPSPQVPAWAEARGVSAKMPSVRGRCWRPPGQGLRISASRKKILSRPHNGRSLYAFLIESPMDQPPAGDGPDLERYREYLGMLARLQIDDR